MEMTKTNILKPNDYIDARDVIVPDEVIAVINELILKKWNNYEARFTDGEMIDTIYEKTKYSREAIRKFMILNSIDAYKKRRVGCRN